MGPSPSDLPYSPPPPDAVWPMDRQPLAPAPRAPEPRTRYVVLLLLTLVTTTLAGADHYFGFVSQLNQIQPELSIGLLLNGLWYSVPILLILGAHELGHYYACRFYNVNASLPYFLPFWLPGAGPGTFGAVIRIRQPIANKRQFFDIGIAGPIAGFLVLLPVLFFALSASNVVEVPADFRGFEFGEPLLFKLMSRLFFGSIPEHYSVNLHPAGWAAWWGMLATALNLAPLGQFDGGHISYAVFGRRSTAITIATALLFVGLVVFASTSYILPTLIVIGMVLWLGPHHPRTPDEAEPLDPARLGLAVFAVVMFILCFTPVPIEIVGF